MKLRGGKETPSPRNMTDPNLEESSSETTQASSSATEAAPLQPVLQSGGSSTETTQASPSVTEVVNPQPVLPTNDLTQLAQAICLAARPSHKIRAPRYAAERDLAEYLTDFAYVAEKNGWDDYEAGIELQSTLTGEPLSLALASPSTSFQAITTILKERLTLQPDTAIDAVQKIRLKGQDVDTLANQCRRLINKGYGPEGLQVPAGPLEALKVRTFIKALKDRHLIQYVGIQKPTTLDEALHYAKEVLKRDQYASPHLYCLDHTEEEEKPCVPGPTIADVLQKLDHWKPDAKEEKKLECFICKGNHFAVGCPQRKKKPTTSTKPKTSQNQGN